MKIQPAHFEKLVLAFRPYKEAYQDIVREFEDNPRIKDKHKAARWQVARMAGMMPFVCDTLYTYLDDNHLDTAFKAAVLKM